MLSMAGTHAARWHSFLEESATAPTDRDREARLRATMRAWIGQPPTKYFCAPRLYCSAPFGCSKHVKACDGWPTTFDGLSQLLSAVCATSLAERSCGHIARVGPSASKQLTQMCPRLQFRRVAIQARLCCVCTQYTPWNCQKPMMTWQTLNACRGGERVIPRGSAGSVSSCLCARCHWSATVLLGCSPLPAQGSCMTNTTKQLSRAHLSPLQQSKGELENYLESIHAECLRTEFFIVDVKVCAILEVLGHLHREKEELLARTLSQWRARYLSGEHDVAW